MYTAIKDAVLKLLETDDRTIETWGEVGLFINAAAMQDAKRAQKELSSQPLSFLTIKNSATFHPPGDTPTLHELIEQTHGWLAATLRDLTTRAIQIWGTTLAPRLTAQAFENGLVTVYNSLSTGVETVYNTFLCHSAVVRDERRSYTAQDPYDTLVSLDPRLSSREAMAALAQLPVHKHAHYHCNYFYIVEF